MSAARDERGQAAVLVAALLAAMLVVAALVVDIGNAKQVARNLQTASDSAADAGAAALATSPSSARTYAADYAFDSLQQTRGSTVTCPSDAPSPGTTVCYQSGNGPIVYVTTPYNLSPGPADGSNPSSADEINVMICTTVSTTFARVIKINTLRPCKSATADFTAAVAASLPCGMCVLDTTGADAFQLGPKSAAKLTITGGSGLVVNSSDPDALELGPKGSACLEIASPGGIAVAGGDTIAPGARVTSNDCSGASNLTPTTGASPIPDPLAALPTPVDRSLSLTSKGAFTDSSSAPQSIGPGIYTSIAATGSAQLTLNPGVYVITGPFTADRGATVTGTGVTLYFTCSGYPAQTNDSSCPNGGGTGGYFSGTGGSTTTLSAPTSPAGDPYTNLLMFYDRNDTGSFTGTNCSDGSEFLDNGGGADTLTGTVYAKSAKICMGGGIITANTLFVVGAFQVDAGASVSADVIPSQQITLPGGGGSSASTALIG